MALIRREFLRMTSRAGMLAIMPVPITHLFKTAEVNNSDQYDVIIVGGSYAGLAAAMALGRALRAVLVIDSGNPCNRQTPYSHNFLTQDGVPPAAIAAAARAQLSEYKTIQLREGLVTSGRSTVEGFEVELGTGETFRGRKLIFATGISDELPEIPGLKECWGISVLHCPYCHGYEVRAQPTGLLGNGDAAFEFALLLSNWTRDLTLYTNGPIRLTDHQTAVLQRNRIPVVGDEIAGLEHIAGSLKAVVFKNGRTARLSVMYSRPAFRQHSSLPELLGCELTPEGYIRADGAQETTVKGIYACGDNASRLRTVANSVAMGTTAGMMASKQLILEAF